MQPNILLHSIGIGGGFIFSVPYEIIAPSGNREGGALPMDNSIGKTATASNTLIYGSGFMATTFSAKRGSSTVMATATDRRFPNRPWDATRIGPLMNPILENDNRTNTIIGTIRQTKT